MPIDALPLWAGFGATVLVFIVAVEGGRWFGSRRSGVAEPHKPAIGSSVAAALATLGFMLAFTFGLAAGRFEDRRALVVDEANAIGTTFLRARMLPEPTRTESMRLLRAYAAVRGQENVGGMDALRVAVAQSEALQDSLWGHAVQVAELGATSFLTGLYVQSLNEVIDLHSTRVAVAIRNRIQSSIWTTLYLMAVIAMAFVGYEAGLHSRRRSMTATVVLSVFFALVLLLIVDLDRPLQGLFQVSQQANIDLSEKLGR